MKSFEATAPRWRGGKLPLWREGLLWECPVREGPESGWGVWRVEDYRAVHLRSPQPWELEAVMITRPRQTLQLVEQLDELSWKAVKLAGGEEVRVYLVERAVQFDRVRAVHDGMRWWSLGPAPGGARKASRLRDSLQGGGRPRGLKPSLRKALGEQPALATPNYQDSLQARLDRAVQRGGGRLVSWRPEPGGHLVVWSRGEQEYRTLVDERLNVLAAGFCLSGQDALQDLTSLVSLIRERPVYHDEYEYMRSGA